MRKGILVILCILVTTLVTPVDKKGTLLIQEKGKKSTVVTRSRNTLTITGGHQGHGIINKDGSILIQTKDSK